MANLQVQKPQLPGPVIRDPRTGRTFRSTFWRDGYFYDGVLIGSRTGATTLADDAKISFFENMRLKGGFLGNGDENNKIPSGWVMKVDRLGLYFPHYWGNTEASEIDIKKIIAACEVTLKVDRDEMKVDNAIFWHGGIGLVGQSAGTGQFFASIGVPSPQAMPKLEEPLYLANTDNNSNTLDGFMTFPKSTFTDGLAGTGGNLMVRPTISGVVVCIMVFHGLIGTKGIIGTA